MSNNNNKSLPPRPNSVREHTDDDTTLPGPSAIPTHPKKGNDELAHTQDTDKTKLSGFQEFNINFPEYHTREGYQPLEDVTASNYSYSESMQDLLDIQNTLSEDEEDETDTFGHTTPWEDPEHAQVQV
jgi:hypothetical protein